MSGAILTALENGPAILAFIQQLVSVGTDAITFYNQVVPLVQNDQAPTDEQWAAAGTSAAAAHAAVQSL